MNQSGISEQLTESHLLAFYGWWQLSVCLFAFVAMMAIWWHIGRKQKDFGQVWLAISILCWSMSGAVEVYYANQHQAEVQGIYKQIDKLATAEQSSELDKETLATLQAKFAELQKYQQDNSYLLNGWRSILSLFNSLFILFALPWFRYIPKRAKHIITSKYWYYIVGLPFIFSLLPTISKMVTGQTIRLINELDVYYATLTLVFLGYVLWESFAKRRLIVLSWLSVLCIVITFVAQIFKLTNSNIDLLLFSAIFKTSLIMIFFALALSWVKELAENVIPIAQHLMLSFRIKKIEHGKFEHAVHFFGIPGNNDRKVLLTPALYELLLKFSTCKFESDGWLEIKPKSDSRPNKDYDIKDHNEIKRLLIALLDGIFGKGSWTKNLHEEPLKSVLFEMSEKRERKIRLKLPVENISLPNQ